MSARKGYRTCVKCSRNRAERFFKPRGRICSVCRKGRVVHASRAVRVEETYGITLDEWEQIWEAQGRCCAICKRTPRYNCDTDHDHQIERVLLGGYAPLVARRMSVRGLLCKTCNRRMLPAAKDNPDWLQNAIEYLANPPAFKVLSPLDNGLT